MLRIETEKTYLQKIEDTVFVVESLCPPNCNVNIMDSLIALMKRDIETLYKK